jgi:hypothetical protein
MGVSMFFAHAIFLVRFAFERSNPAPAALATF